MPLPSPPLPISKIIFEVQTLGSVQEAKFDLEHGLIVVVQGFQEKMKFFSDALTNRHPALEFVKNACRRVGKPPATPGSEALEELRVAEGYEDLPTSSPLGSFNPDLVIADCGDEPDSAADQTGYWEAMARIELEPNQQLYTASADLQNAFYTMEMQVGLTVHEIEFDESDMSVLGWSIASSVVLSPTLKRLWRLRPGVRELIRRGSATGQQLERIVRHITFVSLCRRESLAALGEVYTFIQRHYQHGCRCGKV
ncbi:Uncharacterized protein SCF082_LOCUS49575 [Durusdinium trenchii]|uniref:Uncharacterized protein n=1 Tax=Durusdinium trenchii TaxID=1381693 RepID=A0ABP0S2A8_9DINO